MSKTTCARCASTLEPDARFCGSCGERVAAPTDAGTPRERPPSRGVIVFDPPSREIVARTSGDTAAPTVVGDAPSSARAPSTAVATPSAVGAPSDAGAPSAAAARPTPSPSRDLVGRTLNNRFKVLRKIGEGGFGAVYEGTQIATGREVALKLLHPHNVSDNTVVARFRREAEACSKLRSPHTVTLYDFDETEDGTLYLAMELVRGKSLQHLQRSDGPLPVARALGILAQVADALSEAHDKGIVHRDMKPENIMVERRGDKDFVKVLDFGIAKIVSGDGGKNVPALTAIGQTVGTLEFMSPEQLRGKPLDGRSDIYGLGMMCYEMLTGELPFGNNTAPTQIIQFHIQTPPPPPSRLKPEIQIPEAVDELIMKMAAKSRDERHANAAELGEHIRRTLSSLDTTASRREMVRVVAVVGGIAVVVTAIILLVSR